MVSFTLLSRQVDALPSNGSFSLWVGPLSGDPWFSFNHQSQHYAASTMKVVLVMAAFREADEGRVDLDSKISVHNDFRSVLDQSPYSLDDHEDSDPEPWQRLGSEVSVRWLAYRCLVRSSNLATNLLLEVVGLPPVTRMLAATGSDRSAVTRGIEDVRARQAGLHNLVTAEDLARQLQSLSQSSVVSSEGSQEILKILAAQQINDAIPVRLPTRVRVAHKSGWVEGVSHDAAIISPPDSEAFIFVMCTTSGLDETAGLDAIAMAARAAYDDLGLPA